MGISELSIKRPLFIVVVFTILFLFGFQSYFKLNYNLLPKLQVNVVSVTTLYPGASASEVEFNVTKKLEDKLASIEGLDGINSISQEGVSQITVNLKANADLDQAEREVQRKVDQTMAVLPTNINNPSVGKINLDEAPVVSAGVLASIAPKELYTIIDKQIVPILQNTEGVGQVNIIGGDAREIQVNINQEKLRAYKLTIDQVTQSISKSNKSFPAGGIKTMQQQFSIKFDANLNSVDQIRNLIITDNGKGGVVYLSDIASVNDGVSKTTTINHINGIPSIGIQIVKQADANAVKVSEAVRKQFEKFEKQYGNLQLTFKVSSDQSEYTMASAEGVMHDLAMAVVIVGLVMLFFLHSFRSSLFVMVALPSSIIPTFILMYLMGFSLNLMTLMAMSLVVGILVDDSIVVLENIYRHLEMGSERRKAALEGRNEIGFTALAITLVDVVVFLPLALSGGLIGALLKEFSLVVVFSTLMSLLVSFTITPLLASRFGRLEHLTKSTLWGRINLEIENVIDLIKELYGKLLTKALNKKRWVLLSIFLLLIGSIMLLPFGFIGATFIPAGDKGEFNINLELPPSASVYQTNMLANATEKIILKHPEVKTVFSSIGFVAGSVAGSSNNGNLAQLSVILKDERTISSEDFGIQLQREISEKVPGAVVSISSISVAGGESKFPIQISLQGLDLKAIRTTAEEIKRIAATVPGTQSVELSVKDRKKQIEVELNRDKMNQLGLDASVVGSALQNAFSGDDTAKFKQDGDEFDIVTGLDKANTKDIDNVRNLSFTNKDGQVFLLSQFAAVNEGLGETVLERRDRLNCILVNSNVVGRPIGTVTAEIKEKIQDLKIPEGVTVEYLGDAKNQGEAFGSLGIALLTAILLVYLIMVALYESLVYPFVVLFSIPVALIGALLALALTMETLNIFSIIGIIMLLGLVSKNGILIVDFTNQLRSEGMEIKQALIEAGMERLRPILMTTLAMILGMLPIALANGEGSEIKNGMAWVIIGGLTSSMVLTLFIVPVMYLIIERLRLKVSTKTQNFSLEMNS